MLLSSKNQSLEIALAKGAAISHLTLSRNGKRKTLISPKAGYHYESSLLFPFPNRLSQGKFTFEGTTYKFPLNDFGRPNALHGFISDKPFQILSQKSNAITLQYDYQGNLSYYPFPFRIEVTYRLKPGELLVDMEIKNTGNTAMPCGFGWHPYFDLAEGAESISIQLKGVSKICVDNLIPTGRATPYRILDSGCTINQLDLDTCFEFSKKETVNSTKIHYPDNSTLEVWQDQHQSYVQLYTSDDDKAIAIEPMTCNIDALNNQAGLRILSRGESWSFQFGARLT